MIQGGVMVRIVGRGGCVTGCLWVLVWWVWRGIVPIRGTGETGCAVPSAEKNGKWGVATP